MEAHHTTLPVYETSELFQIPSADTDPPDAIYMWKSCDVCSESSRVATPLVAMSRMAKSYSLAMLLLMLFTENKLKRCVLLVTSKVFRR